ncbi:hypothetical protein D3C73_1161000 [compost metagenome]
MSSWISSSMSTRVMAVQSWPALKKANSAMAAALFLMSASLKTMAGALPPSSRCARLRPLAAPLATAMPARTEPVMETRPGTLWSTIMAPVSPVPRTTLRTPAGKISPARRARTKVDSGVVSEGFRTTVLPAARAGPIFQMAMRNG